MYYEEMSKKLNAVIPDETWEALDKIANQEMRTKSQMAAILLAKGIQAYYQEKESPSSKKSEGVA